MAVYSIYLPPDIGDRVLDADRARVIFLPDTKSLWALIIPAIWLMWNRLWLPFALYMVVLMTILTLGNQWNLQLAFLLSGLPGLYLFLEGNELVRLKFEREGWLFDGILEAPDEETAELRYFADHEDRSTLRSEIISQSIKPVWGTRALTPSSSLFPE